MRDDYFFAMCVKVFEIIQSSGKLILNFGWVLHSASVKKTGIEFGKKKSIHHNLYDSLQPKSLFLARYKNTIELLWALDMY